PLPLLDVTTGGNEITITTAGDYEINYNLEVIGTEENTYIAVVRNNDTPITQTLTTALSKSTNVGGSDFGTHLGTSTIVALDAGDVLDLALTTEAEPDGTTTVLANGDCTLTVKRLDG
ncbi:MAG: hypothetical protein IJX25_05300, partial [Clostridia bacterium]|nr:hypothetical protein [Clostridia bacterium]